MMNIGSAMGMPSASMMNEMRTKMFSKADADGNGGLNVEEFNQMAETSPMGKKAGVDSAEMFKTLDADGDGSLTSSELDTGMKQQMKDMMSRLTAYSGAQDDTRKSGQTASSSSSSNAWLVEQLTKLNESQKYKGAETNPLSVYA